MTEAAYAYEIDLVSRIIAGSSAAEAELVSKYQSGLRSLLKNRCQDTALIEDVLQDSWLVILRKLRAGDLKDSRRLNGFVTQVVRNQLSMAFRRKNAAHESSDELDLQEQDAFTSPSGFLENKQLGQQMATLLKALPKPRDRQLLVKFYYHGDSKAELCKQFQLSAASFDAILARARNRFKKSWKNNA